MVKGTIIAATLGLIAVVFLSLFVVSEPLSRPVAPASGSIPQFFVGVENGWNSNFSDCKSLVDKVKGYTNLLVLSSPSITADEATLNATCDYAYHAGMYLLVYFSMQNYSDVYPGINSSQFRPYQWMMDAKQRYGDHFLGVYFDDEPGGHQLDSNTIALGSAENYTSAADSFVETTQNRMHTLSYYSKQFNSLLFTSDYGLYWFDYKAGYDVVLAQFGWNNSRALQVALARGAATVQGKQWGIMVTWTYDEPPYLESATQLYNDLVLAYNSGAKYAIVYDASKGYQNSTLTQDDFGALKNFWNYMQASSSKGSEKADTALVLPSDYGFGLRNGNDSVWGFKNADNSSQQLYAQVNTLLGKYGSSLDVVYGDQQFTDAINNSYRSLTYWQPT